MEKGTESRPSASNGPVIIDLGKKKRKAVKQLRKGSGKLLAEVGDCIQELRNTGAISEAAQPVIVVVIERTRNRMWL